MSSSGSVTWLGHATAVIDIGGERVLVDPLGRRRCRRAGRYHAVLVTHAHVDHLNRWTLASLDKSVPLMVPKGASPVVADLGFRKVVEVEPGDQLAVGHLDIVGVPTRHDPGRWRKGDTTGNTGYVVSRGGYTVHHSGDVDVSDFDVFDRMGDEFDIDVTLLPIGGMLPVWYYRMRRRATDRGVHIDPDAALDVARRLRAKLMVPVHWGTVHIPVSLARSAPARLQRVANASDETDRVRILRHGQSVDLATRQALPAPAAAVAHPSPSPSPHAEP